MQPVVPAVHWVLNTRYGLPLPSISTVSPGQLPDEIVPTKCIWKRAPAQSCGLSPAVMTAALEMYVDHLNQADEIHPPATEHVEAGSSRKWQGPFGVPSGATGPGELFSSRRLFVIEV